MGSVFLIVLLITIFALKIGAEIHDAFKPKETDWVARRHRKISHNGFKSRAGMR